MPSAPVLVTIAALAAVWAATAALAAWLWRGRRSDRSRELAALVQALSDRLRAVEARLAAVEPPAGRAPTATVRSDRPQPAPAPGPTLIAVPDLAAPPVGHSEAAAELARRFGPLWDLADSGTPAEAIARASGHPIGQVELILGLRRRLARQPGDPEAAP